MPCYEKFSQVVESTFKYFVSYLRLCPCQVGIFLKLYCITFTCNAFLNVTIYLFDSFLTAVMKNQLSLTQKMTKVVLRVVERICGSVACRQPLERLI